jgi:hypothetical protein
MTAPGFSRFRLLVTGRLPEAVAELVADRFEQAAVFDPGVSSDANRTVVCIDGDQASVRALLGLLWDAGQDVSSMCRCQDRPEQGQP